MKNTVLGQLFILIGFLSTAQTNPVHTETYLTIGGIEQWVTIHGDNAEKPIILFLHGGPGSVMSPYSKSMYSGWEKDFIIVNWDQRGAGRTFGRNNPPEELTVDYLNKNPLTINQMINDGIQLCEYLINSFSSKKIILMGSSWGSVLGVNMVTQRPELFHTYIGHSQIVNFGKNLLESYLTVYEMAKKAKDQEAIAILDELGTPPYIEAKNVGKLLRIVKRYEKNNSKPTPELWNISSEYSNELDAKNRYMGDDYSFINFVGHSKLGIKSMADSINFMSTRIEFKIPVHIIQGEADILTSKKYSAAFFDSIKAPSKKYHLVHGAAHSENQDIVAKQYEIAIKYSIITD